MIDKITERLGRLGSAGALLVYVLGLVVWWAFAPASCLSVLALVWGSLVWLPIVFGLAVNETER